MGGTSRSVQRRNVGVAVAMVTLTNAAMTALNTDNYEL